MEPSCVDGGLRGQWASSCQQLAARSPSGDSGLGGGPVSCFSPDWAAARQRGWSAKKKKKNGEEKLWGAS